MSDRLQQVSPGQPRPGSHGGWRSSPQRRSSWQSDRRTTTTGSSYNGTGRIHGVYQSLVHSWFHLKQTQPLQSSVFPRLQRQPPVFILNVTWIKSEICKISELWQAARQSSSSWSIITQHFRSGASYQVITIKLSPPAPANPQSDKGNTGKSSQS